MGRAMGMHLDRLAPGFIVAMPQLDDPNFHRTVVLVLRHTDEGALGVVINRPGEITVAELFADQEIPYAGPSDQKIMVGGPVEFGRHLLVMHGEATAGESGGEQPVTEGVVLLTDREALARVSASGASRLRCYVGYAGWGPGQLENELAEGAWVPLAANARLMFDDKPETVWDKALRLGGIDPVTLVPGGDVN
jgi:putative transcriptional regulator